MHNRLDTELHDEIQRQILRQIIKVIFAILARYIDDVECDIFSTGFGKVVFGIPFFTGFPRYFRCSVNLCRLVKIG